MSLKDVVIRPSLPSDKQTLMDMVNEVYDSCESHLWIKNHERLTASRFDAHHDKKELFIAVDTENKILGCVRMSDVDGNGRELSMLAVRPECRSRGIGRKLADFVIESTKSAGCDFVSVEILFPTHQPDPWKDRLKMWYTSMGFQFVQDMYFGDLFDDAKMLVIDTTFSVYKKYLQ